MNNSEEPTPKEQQVKSKNILYRVPWMSYGKKIQAFLKTRLVGTGALLF